MSANPSYHARILTPLLSGLLSLPILAGGPVQQKLAENHPFNANGELRLKNVNGNVRVLTWDRNEIKIEALKQAKTQEDLDAVTLQIEAQPERVRIQTRYPEQKGWRLGKSNNSTSVDYTITVPTGAKLGSVENVNGGIQIDGVKGEVEASTVNGSLNAKDLARDAKLSSVNGKVQASFASIAEAKSVTLDTVNGAADLALPANADAEVSASTVNGEIRASAGLKTEKTGVVGKRLHGTLGKGHTKVKVSTVNGGIKIDAPSGQ